MLLSFCKNHISVYFEAISLGFLNIAFPLSVMYCNFMYIYTAVIPPFAILPSLCDLSNLKGKTPQEENLEGNDAT